MIVTVASFKGGVSKTTTAVHLAGYLQRTAPTVLIDGDSNRSATGWAARGRLPFRVADERQAARVAREYQHVVIDTGGHPTDADLRALADGCDLLILPSTPDALSLQALLLTVDALHRIGADRFKVLLTIVPPLPSTDADEARVLLRAHQLPVFTTQIRRAVALQKAALRGVLVGEVNDDPRAAAVAADYQAVGQEMTPRE